MGYCPAAMTSNDPWLEERGPREIFFSFDGRIGRRTWWLYGVGAMLGLGVIGIALLRIAGFGETTAQGVVNLVLLWPALAVSVKRWHDRDKSGWWVLLNLVPVIGQLWVLVENGMLRGTRGRNRYGDPEVSTFR
jgi:uncharacterized membrane protein YhaH (DUF805 family)